MIALLPLILANPPPPMFLSYEVIAEGQTMGFEAETCLAVTNGDAYRELWNILAGPMLMMPPVVDFDSSFVLGIFPGERPTAGYGVDVDQVTIWHSGLVDPLVAGGIVITVYATEKCPEGAAAQVITCPWLLLKVKRSPYFPLDTSGQALSVDMSLERCPER
jgi:hypothetical protein